MKFLRTNHRSAFTLTELIVVVVILAILATIGFLAFSSYTRDASSSAVRTNLKILAQAIASESAKNGDSPRRYVEYSSGLILSGAVFSGIVLIPGPYETPNTNYSAGTPNFSALRMDGSRFRNSDGSPFQMGVFDWVETLPSGRSRGRSFFQIAGSPESGISGLRSVLIEGTYPVSMSGTGTSSGLIASSSGSSEALVDASVVEGGAVASEDEGGGASPTQFTFTDSLSAMTGGTYTGSVIISGLGTGNTSTATASGSSIIKNGTDVGTSTSVQDGDVLVFTIVADPNLNATVSASLTVGGVTDSFDVRTAASADVYVSTTRGNDTTGNGLLSNPYKTITKGLAMVAIGGSIYVERGTYEENVSMTKASVTLTGENPDTTIVKNPAANNSSSAFSISWSGVTVRNFSIVNTQTATALAGISIGASNVLLFNNLVRGGPIASVFVTGWTGSKIVNNTMFASNGSNSSTDGSSIRVTGTGQLASFKNNILFGNRAYGFVWVAGISIADAGNNTFHMNPSGAAYNYTLATGDSTQDPLFVQSSFRLGAGSPGIDSGLWTADSLGLSAMATSYDGTPDSWTADRWAHFMGPNDSGHDTFYVAKTGNDTTGNGTQALPYLTISKALLAAADGAKIRVSPGTYQENVSMGKINVSLIGENPGTTVVKNPAANNSTSAFSVSGMGSSVQNLSIVNTQTYFLLSGIDVGASNVLLFNNLIRGGPVAAVSVNGWIGSKIVNNTVFGSNGSGVKTTGTTQLASFKNNILYNNATYGFVWVAGISIADAGYNTYFANPSGAVSNYTLATGDSTQDPSFSQSSFRLSASSPGVDSGLGTAASLGLSAMATSYDGTPDSWTVDRWVHFSGSNDTNHETLYVAKTGNDTTGNGTQALPYLTISKALLAATDGAKIRVSPGTYQENVSMGKINVSLIGENPGTTVVKNPAANNSTSAFSISGMGSSVQNLSIVNTQTYFLLSGIDVGATNVLLFNNLVRGGPVAAVSVNGWIGSKIVNNTVFGSNGSGVKASGTAQLASFKNNVLYGNAAYGFVWVAGISIADAGHNTFFANPSGAVSNYSLATGDAVQDPLFIDFWAGDYRLSTIASGQASDSPCLDSGMGNASDYGFTGDSGTVDRWAHF